MRRRHDALAIAILVLGISPAAHGATIWIETGDAGSLPGSAQVTTGDAPLTSISGELTTGADEDMYLIEIIDPGAFSATTVGGAAFDTQLFLFDSSGFGVYANDDTVDGLQSTLPAGDANGPAAPGLYYLAISQYDNDPLSPGGLIFPGAVFVGVEGPTGPGGLQAVSDWSGSNEAGGSYSIQLSGAVPAIIDSVPEPTSLLLLGTGVAALWRRRAGTARQTL